MSLPLKDHGSHQLAAFRPGNGALRSYLFHLAILFGLVFLLVLLPTEIQHHSRYLLS
jgi:hypothetical protein